MPLYLSEADVAALLTPADALAAVEESFRRLARGVVDNRPRERLPLDGGVFAVMACVDRELGYAGLKSYAWLPGGTPFVVLLFSLDRGAARGGDRGRQARAAAHRRGLRRRGPASRAAGRVERSA